MGTKQCPICREAHEPERGLSCDGCGINSCGTYRDRIATFSDKRGLTSGLLGPMFAAAPDLLEALRPFADLLESPEDYPDDTFECFVDVADIKRAIAAIAKAEGGA